MTAQAGLEVAAKEARSSWLEGLSALHDGPPLPLEDPFEKGAEEKDKGKGPDIRPALQSDDLEERCRYKKTKAGQHTLSSDKPRRVTVTPGEYEREGPQGCGKR